MILLNCKFCQPVLSQLSLSLVIGRSMDSLLMVRDDITGTLGFFTDDVAGLAKAKTLILALGERYKRVAMHDVVFLLMVQRIKPNQIYDPARSGHEPFDAVIIYNDIAPTDSDDSDESLLREELAD
jgi:hypothetical protein